MEAVAVADGSSVGIGNRMLAPGTSAAAPVVVELTRPTRQDTVADETDDKTEEQQCEHFSIRGYFGLLQKKNPKFCSLSRIFHEQKQCDAHQASSIPFSVAKFRRWDCSKCLDKLKTSEHITTNTNVSAKRDVSSDGCSISFIRSTSMPSNVGSKKASSYTPQLSQGKDDNRLILPKSAQEGNSKCFSSSFEKRGVTVGNTDPPAKDLQGSVYNYDVPAKISHNASTDVLALPEVPRITSSEEGNDMDQPSHGSKQPEVVLKLNENENGNTDEILVTDHCNLTKDPKPMSGQKCDKVCSSDPCEEAALRRSVKSDSKVNKKLKKKKKSSNKHTAQLDVSDVKLSRRRPQKLRLLSEIINTSQVGCSRSYEIQHENVDDRCEDDRRISPLELSMDDPVNHQTVGENGLKSTENKTKRKGTDVVDDESSLMNWLNGKKKKITENVHHDAISPVGNLSNPSTSTLHDDENNLQNGLEINMQKTDGICQNGPENFTQMCSSKAESSGLSKRKMHSAVNTKYGDENTVNNSQIPMLRTDDQFQIEPENSEQRCLSKVSPAKHDGQNMVAIHEQSLPKKRKKQNLEAMCEKQPMIDDIPMDIVEMLAKNQHERELMIETDSSGINYTQSKTTADDDCVIVAAVEGPNYASNVLDSNFQPNSSISAIMQKELQGNLASSTHDTSPHPLNLQIADHSKSAQEKQTNLRMEEMVTIAANSPLFPHHYDQCIAEAPTEHWGRKETKKTTWDSFKAAKRNLSTAACGAQFRPSTQAVDFTSTHVMGSSNNYPSHQPVIAPLNSFTDRATNQIQARSFPSTMSTMEAGNLCDRRNAGQSILYPKEPMPATHLLRIMDPSTLAGFPNRETSSRSQMDFQFHNPRYAHNQYKGSTITSYGTNLNGKVPLTSEDLSRRQFQHNLHRPFRPHPRVGVLGSLLQKEIANWSENSGTQSGYRLGVSEGITSHQMNRKEHFEPLNSGMFSAKWNALQLGSVSPGADLLSTRNSIAQSWTRGKGKSTHPLDKFVRQDICVTNRNPADFTTVSDDNEYMVYR